LNPMAGHHTQMNAEESHEMELGAGIDRYRFAISNNKQASFDRQSCTSIETQEARHFISKQPRRRRGAKRGKPRSRDFFPRALAVW